MALEEACLIPHQSSLPVLSPWNSGTEPFIQEAPRSDKLLRLDDTGPGVDRLSGTLGNTVGTDISVLKMRGKVWEITVEKSILSVHPNFL